MLIIPPGKPPALTDYIIAIDHEESSKTAVTFNFTSDPKFNSDYGITSYKLAPSPVEGHSISECPPLCSPMGLCQCTGRVIGDYFYIVVSAINCGTQEGPVKLLTVATCMFRLNSGLRTRCELKNGIKYSYSNM